MRSDLASCMIACDRASKENGCLKARTLPPLLFAAAQAIPCASFLGPQVLRGSHKAGRLDHGPTGTVRSLTLRSRCLCPSPQRVLSRTPSRRARTRPGRTRSACSCCRTAGWRWCTARWSPGCAPAPLAAPYPCPSRSLFLLTGAGPVAAGGVVLPLEPAALLVREQERAQQVVSDMLLRGRGQRAAPPGLRPPDARHRRVVGCRG